MTSEKDTNRQPPPCSITIRDVMNPHCARVTAGTTLREAVACMADSGESDLAVVDHDHRLVGILAVGDILRAAMPDIDEVLGRGGALDDAKALFLAAGERLGSEPVQRLMIESPVRVSPDDDLLKIATLMVRHMIRQLHVVENNRLAGSVCRTSLLHGMFGQYPSPA